MAVMARPVLSAGEIQRMILTENIVTAYKSRRAAMESDNIVKWANDNPTMAKLLLNVEAELDEN